MFFMYLFFQLFFFMCHILCANKDVIMERYIFVAAKGHSNVNVQIVLKNVTPFVTQVNEARSLAFRKVIQSIKIIFQCLYDFYNMITLIQDFTLPYLP